MRGAYAHLACERITALRQEPASWRRGVPQLEVLGILLRLRARLQARLRRGVSEREGGRIYMSASWQGAGSGQPGPGANVPGGGRNLGADVAAASPVLVQMWQG